DDDAVAARHGDGVDVDDVAGKVPGAFAKGAPRGAAGNVGGTAAAREQRGPPQDEDARSRQEPPQQAGTNGCHQALSPSAILRRRSSMPHPSLETPVRAAFR